MKVRKWPLARAIYPHWSLACQLPYLHTENALLRPNVCLIRLQKVALLQQLEKIGRSCTLPRSADISSHLCVFGDFWWRSNRPWGHCAVLKLARGLLWTLVLVNPHSCLGYIHATCRADSVALKFVQSWHCCHSHRAVTSGNLKKIRPCCVTMAVFSTIANIFLLFCRTMDLWCGARITSSAPR